MNKDLKYEQAIARLEEIVAALEKDSVPLEEALALFQEGTQLTAFCADKLKEAKQKITEVEKD